jgi:23S rRNA G2069 N7-methylase RlmK/C1962 C5-methylase RlmI
MKDYYVNKIKQSNGDLEVHESSCRFLPNIENREYIGLFNDCKEAVKKAKEKYAQSDGCYFCSNSCHKK